MDAEIHVATREGTERDQYSEEAETEVLRKKCLFALLLSAKRGTVSF